MIKVQDKGVIAMSKYILSIYLTFTLIVFCVHKALAVVKFEKGEPSQIRELILKQKQEKKRLLIEKYKKEQEEEKEKLSSKGKTISSQKPRSLFRLQSALVTGLFLLTILVITSGVLINYKRQNK